MRSAGTPRFYGGYICLVIAVVEQAELRLLQHWVHRTPHASGATVQGPSVPTLTEMHGAYRRMVEWLYLLSARSWVAAASLVGFEGLHVLFGSMLAVPEFVPLVIMVLGLAALARERWREARVPGLRRRRWLR